MSRMDFLNPNKTKTRPKNNDGPRVIIKQSFAGVIKQVGAENKLSLKSPVWYQNSLNTKFKPGENVSVIITTQKPKRSVRQNNYYWGVFLPAIAEETGERNLDRLHELFKGLFLTKEIVMVLGKPVRMEKSTTELSTLEFSQYIMAIEAETGVAAPPTGED